MPRATEPLTKLKSEVIKEECTTVSSVFRETLISRPNCSHPFGKHSHQTTIASYYFLMSIKKLMLFSK